MERPPVGEKASLAGSGVSYLKKKKARKQARRHILLKGWTIILKRLIDINFRVSSMKSGMPPNESRCKAKKTGGRFMWKNECGSRTNLVITLSSPKIPLWLYMSGKWGSEHCTKTLLAALLEARTRSQKKLLKVMLKKGSFSHVALPSQQYQNIWN